MTADDLQELFSAFGVVAVRRMFGGAGIYADGTMFGLVADGVIYLKADERNAPAYERESLPPFTYATKDGKRGVMSYRRMPGGTIPPHDGHGPLHIAFAISRDELAEWETRLAAHGIAIEGRTKWSRGGESVYFRDPDGHLLELATPGLWAIY